MPAGDFAWGFGSRLVASDPEQQDALGRDAVAVDGRDMVVAVGAPSKNDPYGAVYIYSLLSPGLVRTEVQQLTASDPLPGSDFGASVAIDGHLLVVGAPDADDGVVRGAVYIFERSDGPDTWVEVAKISASDNTGSFLDYAESSALEGQTAVARCSSNCAAPDGAVYVYDLSGSIFEDGFEVGDATLWSANTP